MSLLNLVKNFVVGKAAKKVAEKPIKETKATEKPVQPVQAVEQKPASSTNPFSFLGNVGKILQTGNEKIEKAKKDFSLTDILSGGIQKAKTKYNEVKEKAISDEMAKGFDRETAEKNLIKEFEVKQRKERLRRQNEELLAEQERLNNRNIFEKAWDGTKEFATLWGESVSDQIDRFGKNYEAAKNSGAQDIIRNNFITNSALALTKDFNDARDKYNQDVRNDPSQRNFVLDALGALGNAPTTFVTGTEMAGGEGRSGAERLNGVMKMGMGVVSTMPTAAAFGVAFDTAMPTEAKHTIENGVQGLNQDITNFGMKMGLSEKDAKNIAESLYGAASIGASLLGAKVGSSTTTSVTNKVTTMASNAGLKGGASTIGNIAGKTAGTAVSFGIQATPDIVPLLWQAYKDNKNGNPQSNNNSLAMTGQMLFTAATMIPFKGPKGGYQRKKMQATGQALQDVGNTQPTQLQLFDTAEVVRAVSDGKPAKDIVTAIESSKNLSTEQKTILKNLAENTSEKSLSLIVSENQNKTTDIVPTKSTELATTEIKQNEPTTAMVDISTKKYANIDHLDEKTMRNQMSILEQYSKEINESNAPITPEFFKRVQDDPNILPEVKERFTDIMTNWNAKLEQEKGVQQVLDEVQGKNLAEIFAGEKPKKVEAPAETKLSSLVGDEVKTSKTLDGQTKPKRTKKDNPLTTLLEQITDSVRPDKGETAKNFVAKFDQSLGGIGTIKGVLDKVSFSLGGFKGGGRITLGDLFQGMAESSTRYSRAMYESIGFDKRNISLVGNPIKVTDDMILGGKTPNDKTIYTAENMATAKNFLSDPLKEMPTAVRDEIGNLPKIQQQNLADYLRAEFIYQINKDNPQKLNSIFTPDQIKQFQGMEKNAKNLFNTAREYLVKHNLLPEHLADDDSYMRYVTTKSGQEAMQKMQGEVRMKVGDREVTFTNMESANAFVMSLKARGDNNAHAFEKIFASILKEKAIDYDTQRIHSPALQIVSYAQDTGVLIKNKSILDVLRDVLNPGKDATPEQLQAKQYVEKFDGAMINQILGISQKGTGFWGKTADGIAATTRFTAKSMLFGRVHLIPQAIVTGGGRAALERTVQGIKNLVNRRDGVDFVTKKILPETKEILSSHGFSPLALATSDVTKAGGWFDRIAANSSGAFVDSFVKQWVSLGQMKIDMQNAGIKVDTTDANVIAKMYDDFSRDPKYKNAYLESQATIQGKLNGLGGSTWATQPAAEWVRKTNVQALKGYVFGQINRFKQDIFDMFTTETSKSQRWDAVQRQAQNLMIYGVTVKIVKDLILGDDAGVGEEEAEEIATRYANSFVGTPPLQAWETLNGITSSPFFTSLSIATNSGQAGWSAITGNPDAKIQFQEAFTELVNTIGATRAVNLHTNKGLTDYVADKIGTVNTDRLDNYGRANVYDDSGAAASLFGFMPEKITEQILTEEIQKSFEVQDKEMRNDFGNTVKPVTDMLTGLVENWRRPLEKTLNLGESKYDIIEAQQLHDIYKDITIDDSLESYLKKRGINVTPESIQGISNMIWEQSVTTRKKNIEGWQNFEIPGTQFLSSGKFGEYMQKLEKADSYTYTKILTGLKNLEKFSQAENGKELDYVQDFHFRENLKTMFAENQNDQGIYAAITKTSPLTSRLSQQFYKAMNTALDTVSDKEELKTLLDGINNFFQKTESMGNFNAGVKKSIETDSDNIINLAEKMKKIMNPAEVFETLKNFPLIGKYVGNGMRWRGWIMDENGSLQIPDAEKLLGTNDNLNSNSGTKGLSDLISSLPTATGGGGKGKGTTKGTGTGTSAFKVQTGGARPQFAKQSQFKSLYELVKDPNLKVK